MSDTEALGGFIGDRSTAPTVTGAGGCCGDPSQAAPASSEPVGTTGPCCGSQAEATAEASCCGSAAKAHAVAAGQGCCG